MTEMYGSYSDEDLNEWERSPQNIRVLTSSAFGAWLLRRDKRIKEQETKTDVLDKIRAEIDSHCSDNRDRNDGLYIAMKIIDKYMAEGSEKCRY